MEKEKSEVLIPEIRLLGTDDVERINEQALEILQKVGIKFGSKRAVSILEDAGCDVDRNDLSAKIPVKLVEQSLKTLPSSFPLAGLDPKNDFICGDGGLYYTSITQPPWIRDLRSRERRLATLEDLVLCARLTEAMDEIQEWCPMVLPNDVPTHLRSIKALQISILHNSKHIMGMALPEPENGLFMECFDAVLGDRKRLRERPIFTVLHELLSPLSNDGYMLDNLLGMAPYRPPVLVQCIPLAGATAPITLSGTVLQETAEFLGTMTLLQIVEPGWPLMWGTHGATIDMRSGQYAGGPESMLMTLALLEMAKHYNVPCNAHGTSSSDSKSIGYIAGMEAMFAQVITVLAGVDNIWWPGSLDGYNLMDLPNVILGRETALQMKRMRQGMKAGDEHLMLDLIMKMNYKGEYLGDISTKKYFKEEYMMPELFPRETFENWSKRGKSEEEIASDRVNEILDNHDPRQVAPEIVNELDRIVKKAEQVLAK